MKSANQEIQPTHSLEKVTPKSLSIFQLATLYGVTAIELIKQLGPHHDEIGEPEEAIYDKNQVERIFSLLGTPCVLKKVQVPKAVVLPGVIEMLVVSTWNFTRAILWGGQKFTSTEIEIAKDLIRLYYRQISPEKFYQQGQEFFIQYLERVLLVRQYLDRHESRFIPHPCIWLDRDFSKGFAGTKSWYKRIQDARKVNPKYHQHIRQIAELYAEYILNPSPDVFHKAAKAFSYRDSNLLLLFCANLHDNSSDFNQTA